ncbi:MAG: helix-turn-helix transcriptional regulator [Clostridia bacterium]|nr:helix-turn-helix transcriptional regulator [Clostridia bacterium]
MITKYPRQVRIIRDARKAMGYSQQQVATIIGVHIRQYQRIECGERDIRFASMKLGLSICALLGIDPLVLVFGGDFQPLKINDEENFPNATGRTLLE